MGIKIENLESQVDSLFYGFLSLHEEKNVLRQRLQTIYFEELKEMEQMVRDAFDKTDVISISATYQEVIKSIMSLHNEIARINNFTDAEKVFGVDFSAYLYDLTEKKIIHYVEPVNEDGFVKGQISGKEHLRTIIRDIIENPIISGILKSNPITSVAHSIINQLIIYQKVQNNPYLLQNEQIHVPGNYKNFKEEYSDFKASFTNNTFSANAEFSQAKLNKSIDEFTQGIKPMMNIFDQLSRINEKYSSSLEVYMNTNEQTIKRAKPLELEYYRLLKANNRQEASEIISNFFNVGENPPLELLESKVSNKEMKRVLAFSFVVREGLEVLKHDFLNLITLEIELTSEYLSFFNQYLERNKDMDELVNQKVIQNKIGQFEQLHNSLHEQKKRLEN